MTYEQILGRNGDALRALAHLHTSLDNLIRDAQYCLSSADGDIRMAIADLGATREFPELSEPVKDEFFHQGRKWEGGA